jgi:hypothetical protein
MIKSTAVELMAGAATLESTARGSSSAVAPLDRKTNRLGDDEPSPCARVRNVGRATWANIAEIGGDPICRDRPLGLWQRETP